MTPTPEALTPEERERLSLIPNMLRDGDRTGETLAKLLRIHDQQAARIEELERQLRENLEELPMSEKVDNR